MLEVPHSKCTDLIFHSVVQLCENRIIGRLKCKDWITPAYHSKRRRPMHEDLLSVFNRYLSEPNRHPDQMKSQASRLRHFMNFMIQINRHDSTLNFQTRLEALRLAGTVCDIRQSLELALEQAGIKIDVISGKAIKAFNKVANYWHISKWLSRLAASCEYRHLLGSCRFKFLAEYAPHRVLGRERFVHAEIQIVTFHRLKKTLPLPRTIGTSKAACYLCDLFLSHHSQYTISATHGTIFDAWTIPDILPYSVEDRKQLRAIIQSMQAALEARARKGNQGFLQFAVQSGIYHIPSLPSLAETVIGPASLAQSISPSIVRSSSENQITIGELCVGPVGEVAGMSMSDRNAVSPPAAAAQNPCEHCAVAKAHHCKDRDSRLEQQVKLLQDSELKDQVNCNAIMESGPGRLPHREPELKAGPGNHKVSAREGTFDEIYDNDCKRPQMVHTSSAQIERPDSSRQLVGKEIESSPHSDVGEDSTSVAYPSSKRVDGLSSVSEPPRTKVNASQKRSTEADQEVEGRSSRHPRERRRRQRRRVRDHPNRKGSEEPSRRLRSSRNKTYQRHGNRVHSGLQSHKKSHHRSSRNRFDFLQSLWRAIRGAQRLCCL